MHLELNGSWLINYSSNLGKEENPITPDYIPNGWIPAQVPGTVQQALLAAGRIEEPFYRDNAEKCKWIEHEDWWYRKEFYLVIPAKAGISGQKITLDFDGLDTFATIYLNGKWVGEHNNMFVGVSFEVTKLIRLGQTNVLVIKFSSPILAVKPKVDALQIAYGKIFENRTMLDRAYARRAQVTYGWDFAPRLINVGIWRGVRLTAHTAVSISSIFAKSKLSEDKKEANVEVEINLEKNVPVTKSVAVQVEIKCGNQKYIQSHKIKLNTKQGKACLTLTIKNPKLWFPHNVGTPKLYNIKVTVKDGKKVLAEKSDRFGIREIKLVEKMGNETTFTFNINGINVFAKGANWVPGDALTVDMTPEKYEFVLNKAKEANMNMLRIWGGGIYENDKFYQLCDQLGIMVWHDFMFACDMYPDEDREFMLNVEQEAKKAVTRLRNHPSIVLWCGNNENQQGWAEWGWSKLTSRHFGEKIYHELLPKVVSKLDPTRPYHPGSPFGGSTPNSREAGDVHNWNIWHGEHNYREFENDTARFFSEYGMQAAPHIDTVKKYLAKEDLYPIGKIWEYHHLDYKKINAYLAEFGEVNSAEDFVTISQITQAYIYKFAIESFRRRKWSCSGSLFWQYNDPWPTTCWSVIDYYNKPKAGYFLAKRAYRPILPVFLQKDGKLSIWIINDTLTPVKSKLEIFQLATAGKKLTQKPISVLVNVPANSSVGVVDNILIDSRFRGNDVIPAENNVIPAENDVIPAENNVIPAENNVIPAENNVIPA
ncbi:MAG: glycoside hydrolase family 2 TIM barrel-domain containing protein, partial [bacterium]|nr:glycoside hydrolase family 2 TIM barrel-domain containing protein [bacterium]